MNFNYVTEYVQETLYVPRAAKRVVVFNVFADGRKYFVEYIIIICFKNYNHVLHVRYYIIHSTYQMLFSLTTASITYLISYVVF